jgi:hypothetical protein
MEILADVCSGCRSDGRVISPEALITMKSIPLVLAFEVSRLAARFILSAIGIYVRRAKPA